MTAVRDYPSPPPPPERTLREASVAELLAGEWLRDHLQTFASTQPRSLQAHLGPSEIGQVCNLRLWYRLQGTPIVNMPDPLKSLFGVAFHAWMAEHMLKLDGGSHRYLIEHQVRYRGISGSLDLHDRYRRRCWDWKTTSLDRIKQYRADGVPNNYLVQINIYGQGLLAEGEQVDDLILAFIPRDGKLSDAWLHAMTPDKALADESIDRYDRLSKVTDPPEPSPGVWCGYCPNYREHAADIAVACPGRGD